MNPSKSANFLAGLAAMGSQGGDAVALIKAMVASAEMAVGEYTGTGAALDVALPFEPSFVAVFDLSDAASTAGFAFNTTNAGTKSYVLKPVATTPAASQLAMLASQGITFTAGSKKFTLGTDTNVNNTGKTYQYVAFGF